MTGLTTAREAVAREVAHALPPDDLLRPLMDGIIGLVAALEAERSLLGQDAVDRVAHAAACGAQQHALALVRAIRREGRWLAAGVTVLVALASGTVGWLVAGWH